MTPAMVKKPTSFEMVMAAVLPKYREKTGHDDGVQTWLAGGLGITKQAMTGFKDRGRFPTKYLREISKFTGVPMTQMQPILTEEVLDLSRKMRLSVRDTELQLICIGLDNINRK
jgi:hypothetical protein